MAVVSKGKAKPSGKGAPAKKPPLPTTFTCPKCGYSGPAAEFAGGPPPEEAAPPAVPGGMPGGAMAGGQMGF